MNEFGLEQETDLREIIQVIRAGLFSTTVSDLTKNALLDYCLELEDLLDSRKTGM